MLEVIELLFRIWMHHKPDHIGPEPWRPLS